MGEVSPLLQYGVFGALILVLGWLLKFVTDQGKEHKEQINSSNDRYAELAEQVAEALQANQAIMQANTRVTEATATQIVAAIGAAAREQTEAYQLLVSTLGVNDRLAIIERLVTEVVAKGGTISPASGAPVD